MPARTVLHGSGIVHAEVTDDLHHDDAEGEARQCVHGVVALEKASEKRLGGIVAEGFHVCNGDARRDEHHDDEDGEEHEEAGGQDLADPGEDLAGTQRKEERRGEERDREEQQVQRGVAVLRQDLLKAHGEGGRRAAGNGEERPDGQIQRAGEKHGVGAIDLAAQVKETRRAADAERGHAEQRQAHGGDEEAQNGLPDVRAGHLAEMHGEDEVAGAEEEAEEHTGNVGIFFSTEFVFHGYFSFRGGDAALVRAVPKMIVVTKNRLLLLCPPPRGYPARKAGPTEHTGPDAADHCSRRIKPSSAKKPVKPQETAQTA